ncbi:hypothetical protein CHGG_09910 [Chaetomium globosum CBS 148.51]|uniref:Uncharacterized protein n=1 Tax=Chaetomium globosum (strain ATCC 6205 / CBS 148.51 / DSM 1962 / NBRC 6347 / NRRL 1970) TaxID=306901 RepID=Q2GQ44_CHAGB|nr:uncharacterized protein CHGG_09910 [Chaetomium globosum CBS 148.51]EAQ83506.1 hypothetical protein CHGG_09910 [Chaetomium globosum CBS 148.51]
MTGIGVAATPSYFRCVELTVVCRGRSHCVDTNGYQNLPIERRIASHIAVPSLATVTMPRALQYRTKLAIIRRRLQRRRPRHADPVEVDDDAAFADIPSGSGDFDQGSDFGDDWEPQAVTDFDENELAHALVDAAIEEDHVVYPDPDPDTGEYQVADDAPLQSELRALDRVTAMTTGENPTQDLFFLNPVDFLSRIEGSQLAKGMHYGLADLVDSPIEAWHSMQWAGSVRTTSGVFVWYPPLPASPKDPIFPGDIVDFECTFRDCRHCHSADDTSKPHVGQVMAVYRDRRDSTRDLGLIAASNNNVDQAQQGDVVLVIARVLRGHVIKNIVANQAIEIKTNPTRDNVTDNEWVLSYSPMELVPSAKIRGRRTDIGFDYAFGSQVEFDDDPRERIGMPLIRRIFMKEQCAFMPPCLGQVRSLPCLDFNDGFGLYRTMTKSIMGCYLQIAAMPRSEHTRQINVLPVTLGPHGANFDDVMKALAPLKALDQGITVAINGVETLLCAPIIAFTGDMPQQQDNSGCLSVAANLGCRNFQQVAPALDLISGRPGDAAHSEFNGITKMTHQILIDAALKPDAVVAYSKILRQMPFPPGWARIQSPYNVLNYSLQEHARWSVLMTIISLLWLTEADLKRPFVQAVRGVFSQTELTRGQATNTDVAIASKVEHKSAVEILTLVLAAIVKTNEILSAPELDANDRDPATIMDTIRISRRMFQLICEAASRSTNLATGAAAAAAARRRGSLASSRAGSVAPSAPRPAAGNTIEPVHEEDEEAVDDDINIGQLETQNIVLTMNHRNPEKDCLAYENMLQTVRLTLLDGFRYDDPDITTDIKNLASAAPSLFSSLLPREGLQNDDDDSSIWDIIARVYQDMGFPVREGALVPTFLWMLRDAYRVDYDKNIIVTTNWHIRWWKKVSFGDGPISTKPKGVQRLVYQRGQFVKYRDGNVGRLEHIMTHEAVHGSGQFFVFLVITPLADTGSTEPLTGLPILKMAASGANIAMAASLEDCRHRLIGLPALRRDRLYMVPFTTGPGRRLLTGIGNTELEADTELLWVNWRVQFT